MAKRPDVVTDLLQIVKTVIAATGAWWLSDTVLNSQMPFLAPWAALLTVHATVHRSLSRGAQSTIASTLGVALSFVIGNYLGVSIWTFALALLVGLAAARLPWIRDEGVAIATTGIFILGSGFDSQQPLLGERILELCLGIAVGIVVNLLVIPPLRDQQAARYVDSINRRMGDMLIDMADELDQDWDTANADDWFRETESMSEELNSAWQSVKFARESQRANPRRRLRRKRNPSGEALDSQTSPENASYESILQRVDEGISHLRHLTRTLREGSYEDGEWDTRFREQWTSIVRDAGRAIADPDAEVEPIFKRLEQLSVNMADEDGLPERSWPLYGSLIASMQHIAAIVDDVASAREAREAA
ncbi:MAG: aromatic acid exporter family protein [Brevibacterium sp.]|uniref:FUSC family protein n=1 Tax=Brevibacterium sandarakinum TaxID=629680 RepID=UPI002656006C|nr:aromatic acid exporter family protein [Brevibacterium sandarakinum]MDN5608623.1 aromatic acid exporter family protein [Brevibacterium sp.]MDN5657586.1 aromatic acid exporter family protein [Brevibacterium sandarakinum]